LLQNRLEGPQAALNHPRDLGALFVRHLGELER
jgi:hypothetical protein